MVEIRGVKGWNLYGKYHGWVLYRRSVRHIGDIRWGYAAAKKGFECSPMFEETRDGIRRRIRREENLAKNFAFKRQ